MNNAQKKLDRKNNLIVLCSFLSALGIVGSLVYFGGKVDAKCRQQRGAEIRAKISLTLTEAETIEARLMNFAERNKDRILDLAETRELLGSLGYHELIDSHTSFHVYHPDQLRLNEYRELVRAYNHSNVYGENNVIHIPVGEAKKILWGNP